MRRDPSASVPVRTGEYVEHGPGTDGYSAIPFPERHVMDYVRVLYKRRWTALPVVLVVVGFVAYNTLTATPIYEASAQLLIEAETQNIIAFQQVVEQERARLAAFSDTASRMREQRARLG